MFEAAVEGFGGSVGGTGPLEVGQDVGGALVQGPAEATELDEGRGHAVAEGVDDGGHRRAGGCPVGVGEQDDESFSLAVGEQVLSGVWVRRAR